MTQPPKNMIPFNHHLIDAYRNWFIELNEDPHISVSMEQMPDTTMAPYAEDGILCVNIAPSVVSGYSIDQAYMTFSAMVDGTPHTLVIPIDSIIQVYVPGSGDQQLLGILPPIENYLGSTSTHRPFGQTPYRENVIRFPHFRK